MLWELAVLFGLVIANGVLAGAEIAIVGFDKMRLKHLVERRDRRARAIHELAQGSVIEHRDDQEYAARARGARLEHLIRISDEVLAHHRARIVAQQRRRGG